MTTEQRNLITTFVAIALVLAGVYYFQKNKEIPPLTPPNLGGLPAQTGEETPNTTSPNLPLSGEEENIVPPAKGDTGGQVAELTIKQKFDAAMANASKAFLKGDYALALKYYNDALLIQNRDVVYSGMFNVYSAEMNWVKAQQAINTALDLNPRYTEHWKSKLTLLDERTGATFLELKQIYENGLAKGDSRTKINLITHFALIAERNGEKSEAISLWEYAKTINGSKASVYQAEIDRLRSG